MMRPSLGRSPARRGAALVEFALVSVELLLVVFAVIEFSRMALVYTNLASAARIAVRYAVTHGSDRTGSGGYVFGGCGQGQCNAPATPGDICGQSGIVADYVKAGLLNTNTLTSNNNCTVSGAGGPSGTAVQVTLTYPYDPFVGIFPFKLTLRSNAQGIITF